MILFIVDVLMFVLTKTPMLGKKVGVGLEDDFSDFNEVPKKSQGNTRTCLFIN